MPFSSVIASSKGGESVSNTTDHPITVSTHASGDRLFLFFVKDGITTPSANPADQGWTESFEKAASAHVMWGGWIDADASNETANFTTDNQRSAYVCFTFEPGVSTFAVAPPLFPTAGAGNSTDPNPPSIASGAIESLAIAICSWNGTNTVTSWPTNWDTDQDQEDSSDVGLGWGTDTTTDDPVNPGDFAIATMEWIAQTVLIPPAAATGIEIFRRRLEL